ncbi:hypothetical protein D1BOALGB6SA_5325 [Olavius sp. associated proteobacterium Delta 1]|nr:hypothetical protein D1BOALGB6SA_5325 [Olavius sp. associated proteobacterium Delta 1]
MSENRPLQSVLNHVPLIPGITMVKFPIYITLRIFISELITKSNLLTGTVLQKVIGEHPGRSPFGRPHKILNT